MLNLTFNKPNYYTKTYYKKFFTSKLSKRVKRLNDLKLRSLIF